MRILCFSMVCMLCSSLGMSKGSVAERIAMRVLANQPTINQHIGKRALFRDGDDLFTGRIKGAVASQEGEGNDLIFFEFDSLITTSVEQLDPDETKLIETTQVIRFQKMSDSPPLEKKVVFKNQAKGTDPVFHEKIIGYAPATILATYESPSEVARDDYHDVWVRKILHGQRKVISDEQYVVLISGDMKGRGIEYKDLRELPMSASMQEKMDKMEVWFDLDFRKTRSRH